MLGPDLFNGGSQGAREGQTYRRRFFRFVFKPNGAAVLTPDTSQADYEAIPDGARVVDAMAKVKTTLAGNAVSTSQLGDGGDADRWGVAAALTRNSTYFGSPGAMTPVRASSYAPKVTNDQIITSGEVVALYVVDVPQFDFTFPA